MKAGCNSCILQQIFANWLIIEFISVARSCRFKLTMRTRSEQAKDSPFMSSANKAFVLCLQSFI